MGVKAQRKARWPYVLQSATGLAYHDMAGVTRKRGRGEIAVPEVPQKRKLVAEDEDIDSDDADSHSGDESAGSPSEQSEESADDPNETVEEKRLRFMRRYMNQMGVDMNAGVDDDEDADEEARDENERNNATLREGAMRSTGRATTYVADSVGESLQKSEIRSCKGHALPPTCVALAAVDEATAVSGGKDSRVIVWDVETGARTHTFKATDIARGKKNPTKVAGHIGNILTVAVSDDGQIIASGGDDGLVRVWDARAGKIIESLRGHRGPIQGVAFRSGTRQLFSASRDRTVKIWDLNDMAYVETLFGHGGEVNAIDSLAKERAMSCGRDGTLRLYKVVEGSQLVFRRALTSSIDAIAMVSEQRFVSGGDDGAVCLWQMNKKKPTAFVASAHGAGLGCEAWVSCVAAFRNTDLVVSGGGDGIVRFWKCEDKVPKLLPAGQLNVGPGFVNGIAVGERRRILVAAVGSEHRLGRWGRIRGAKNSVRIVSLANDDK